MGSELWTIFQWYLIRFGYLLKKGKYNGYRENFERIFLLGHRRFSGQSSAFRSKERQFESRTGIDISDFFGFFLKFYFISAKFSSYSSLNSHQYWCYPKMDVFIKSLSSWKPGAHRLKACNWNFYTPSLLLRPGEPW